MIAFNRRRSETLISPITTPTSVATSIAQKEISSVTRVPWNM